MEFVFSQVMYILSSTAGGGRGGGLYYSHLIAFLIICWLDIDLSAAELLV